MRKRWILATAVVALFASSAMEAEAQCGGGRGGGGLFHRLRERRQARQEPSSCGEGGCDVAAAAAPGYWPAAAAAAALPAGTLPVYVVEGGNLRQIGVISTGGTPTSMPGFVPAAALPR